MILKGRLIDGKGACAEKAIVEIQGERITRVETGLERGVKPEGFLDLGNMTIMPGLIDSHVHLWGDLTMDFARELLAPPEMKLLRAAQDLRRCLDAGYTSIRDMASRHGSFLRDAVKEGTIEGPRIKTPRLALSQTGGHLDKHFMPLEEAKPKIYCRITDGADECRRAVREQFREGADFIKICVTGGVAGEKEGPHELQLSPEEIRTIIEEADKKGRKVSAHIYGTNGIKLAVQLGVKTIEHGVFLDEEACEQMVKKDVILIPTLTIPYKFATEGEKNKAYPWAAERARRVLDIHAKSFQLARRMGVKIAAGTDFSGGLMVPFGENAFELEMMVKAGSSPMEAIMAATKMGGEVMGMDSEIGTIEPGKVADIIVVDGNPLENIRMLQEITRIKLVMIGGKIVKSGLPNMPR